MHALRVGSALLCLAPGARGFWAPQPDRPQAVLPEARAVAIESAQPLTGCPCNPDVNKSGSVNLTDVNIVTACISGNCSGCVNSCDVNCDCVVDVDDRDAVLCRFGGGPECCAPKDPSEACCLPNNSCSDLIPACCTDAGGVPNGAGTSCGGSAACCLGDNSCTVIDATCCGKKGGTPNEPGSVCGGPETCCFPDGSCAEIDALCCQKKGGGPDVPGTVCGIPEACCLPDNSCREIDTCLCLSLGGTPNGVGSTCGGTGACCLADGSCAKVDATCCFKKGGTPNDPGSACGETGACCFSDSSCSDMAELCCLKAGGAPSTGSACAGTEACCFPDKSCSDVDAFCCLEKGGDPQGLATACMTTCCFVSSSPQPELVSPGGPINLKSRVLSFRAGDPGQIQLIRVVPQSLPAPFDVWDCTGGICAEWWVGPPARICEHAAQAAPPMPLVPPDYGCTATPGLLKGRRWNWYAPLVCDKTGSAEARDWHGVCAGGACVGGLNPGNPCAVDDDCQDLIHVYHEAIIPTDFASMVGAAYEITVIDVACPQAFAGSYSPPLVMTQAQWADLVGIFPGCPRPPPQGMVDLQDVNALLQKFANVSCQIKKTRGDLRSTFSGLLDFRVDLPDVNAALIAFGVPGYPFVPIDPTDPCGLGLGEIAGEREDE